MVKTSRMLVMSDRIGSWKLHLAAAAPCFMFAKCLPLFAAAGHLNYVKSSYLYLQNMSQLELKHPDVFKKFQLGYHVVRRTDKSWAWK